VPGRGPPDGGRLADNPLATTWSTADTTSAPDAPIPAPMIAPASEGPTIIDTCQVIDPVASAFGNTSGVTSVGRSA
jgi:hypothetical protein